MNPIRSLDESVFRRLTRLRGRHRWHDALAIFGARLMLPILFAGIIVHARVLGDALYLLLAFFVALVAWGLAVLIEILVGRSRPYK